MWFSTELELRPIFLKNYSNSAFESEAMQLFSSQTNHEFADLIPKPDGLHQIHINGPLEQRLKNLLDPAPRTEAESPTQIHRPTPHKGASAPNTS